MEGRGGLGAVLGAGLDHGGIRWGVAEAVPAPAPVIFVISSIVGDEDARRLPPPSPPLVVAPTVLFVPCECVQGRARRDDAVALF